MELPHDIPVLSVCAPATKSGWQAVEACLFDEGFEFAKPSRQLKQLEIDSRIANGLSFGETVQEATPKGDITTDHRAEIAGFQFDVPITDMDGLYLLVDFDNTNSDPRDLHRVYTRADGLTSVITQDYASTTLNVISQQPWPSFDAEAEQRKVTTATVTEAEAVRKLEYESPFDEPTLPIRILYRILPSMYPGDSSWSILHVHVDRFQEELGRPSDFVFDASFTHTRRY